MNACMRREKIPIDSSLIVDNDALFLLLSTGVVTMNGGPMRNSAGRIEVS